MSEPRRPGDRPIDLLRRIGAATRETFGDLGRRSAERSGRSLAELSDSELQQELMRRRRARRNARNRPAPPTASPGASESPQAAHEEPTGPKDVAEPRRLEPRQVRQYYANLELEPGASRAEVEAAYRRLMQRYHPDQHQQDPERFRAATELADSLTEAYRALTTHLSR